MAIKPLEACLAKTHNLVPTDIEMPELDGVAATAEIIARPGTNRPRSVALIANAMADDRERHLAREWTASEPARLREELVGVIETAAR
jgi:CheY-like chemotaxis protein